MAEIVYDADGSAFELRSGGASLSGMHRSIRGAMEHTRSVSAILDDPQNHEALVRALTKLGRCSLSAATSMSHDTARALTAEALSSGALALAPYTAPRRIIATVHETPAPSLTELVGEEVRATHTLELRLIDAAGEPVAGEPYRVELPDGHVVEGRLDARGVALLTGIVDTGSCVVNFPSWDKDAWKPV